MWPFWANLNFSVALISIYCIWLQRISISLRILQHKNKHLSVSVSLSLSLSGWALPYYNWRLILRYTVYLVITLSIPWLILTVRLGPFQASKKDTIESCTPDEDIRVFDLDRQFLSHPGPDKNHVYLMHWLYRKSHIYVVKWRWFLQVMTSWKLKNDVSLCKLHVNVKNRRLIAGSVGFFQLA